MNENHLKLHKSHKIVCFIVCFVIVFGLFAITASAQTYNYTFVSPPYVTDDTANKQYIRETVYPILDNISVGNIVYFPTDNNDIRNLYVIRNDTEVFNIGFTVRDPDSSDTYDLSAMVIDFSDNDVYISNGIIDLSSTSFSFNVSISEGFSTVITAFFPDSHLIEYDGNPWADILNGVVNALDVNIFGTFSYLDIVSTLAGACLCIWLLKMLAGG